GIAAASDFGCDRKEVIVMIDLRLFSGSLKVAPLFSISNGEFEFSYGLLFDPGGIEVPIGSPPLTGEPNWIGDKPCLHYNWHGSLLGLPYGSMSVSHEKMGDGIYPVYSTTYHGNTYRFTAIGEQGHTGSQFRSSSRIYRKVTYEMVRYIDWYWQNDCLVCHWSASDFPKGTSPLYYNQSTIVQIRFTSDGNLQVRSKTTPKYRQPTRFTFDDVYPTELSWQAMSWIPISGSVTNPTEIIERTKRTLTSFGNRVDLSLPPVPGEMWGDLADSSIQNARALDINSLAYAADFLKLKQSVRTILSLLRGKFKPKDLASAWLEFKYGLRLTFADSKELGEAIGRAITKHKNNKFYSVCRAMDTSESIISKSPLRGSMVHDTYYYKVYYQPIDDAFLSLIRKMMDWDVSLTLQNIWDLIPLSFVVDWFVDFERTLSRIDANTYANTLRVLGTIKTRKSTISSIPATCLMSQDGKTIWSGDLTLEIYKRNLQRGLDLPLFRSGSPEAFHNLAELLAIIVQRR
ncbi:TPA_asm: maturation protein, partial [ssRNA phage SRR7976310_4]